MYDRQTESWWQQATGEGIVGRYAGRRLEPVSAPLVNWQTFKDSYPRGQVLSPETGYDRPYGSNPYARYDDPKGSPIAAFFRGGADRRLPAMERVVAVTLGGEDVAYAFSELRERRVINDRLGGVPITVFWVAGTASAVDASEVSRGRDVGATGVFDRRVDGRTLDFEASGGDVFRDRLTGSQWNLLGQSVSGAMKGRQLTPVPYGNHFWFAWAVFKPATRVEGAHR